MRYLSTPKFARHLAGLPRAFKEEVKRLLTLVSDAKSTESLLHQLARYGCRRTSNDIYVLRVPPYRVFITFGTATSQPYLLFVDIANLAASPHQRARAANLPMSRSHDPRLHGRVNPFTNGNINPNVNGHINPLINGHINPNVNGHINPNVNGHINPNVNGNINPNVNGHINPNVNARLNPAISPALDQIHNANHTAPIIYDLELEATAYLVPATNDVTLVFDTSNTWIGVAVAQDQGGYVLFDKNLKWYGYMVADGQGGYVTFETNGKWTGFAV